MNFLRYILLLITNLYIVHGILENGYQEYTITLNKKSEQKNTDAAGDGGVKPMAMKVLFFIFLDIFAM